MLSRGGGASAVDFYRFYPNTTNNFLHKVTDGLNATIAFEYKRLTNSTIYSHGSTTSYPLNNARLPILVTSKLDEPNGIGGITSTTYYYQQAKLHRAGLGFLGFGKISISNLVSNRIKYIDQSVYTDNSSYYRLLVTKGEEYVASLGIGVGQSDIQNEVISLGNGRFWERTKQIITNDYISLASKTSTLTYDSYGNTTKIVENIQNGLETRTIDHYYGTHGTWIPSSADSTKIVSTRTGQLSHTKRIHRIFNTKGLLEVEKDFFGLPKSVTTTSTYDPQYGIPTSTTVSASGLTSRTISFLTYDSQKRYPTTIINPLGQTKSVTYDSRWGKPLSVTDFDGLVYSYTYDGYGREKTMTTPESHVINTKFEWPIVYAPDYSYRIVKQIPGRPDFVTYHDLFGRVKRKEIEGFNNSWMTSLFTYDNRGNLKTETNPVYTTETPVTTTYNYDDYNRINTRVNSAFTTQFSYNYTGGHTKVTVTNLSTSQVNSQTTDATGKLVTATDHGGVLNYEYNSIGNLKKVKLDNADLVTMDYDEYGRQKWLTDKNAGTTNYDYNAFGELKSQTDAKGNTTTFNYDNIGRLTTRIGAEGTTTYEFWPSGNGKNRLKKVTGFNGINEEYVYDNLHRPIQQKETIDGTIYTTSFSYTTYSDLQTVTYPSGFGILREYDGNGYLKKVKNSAGTITLFSANAIDGFGNYTNYTLGNGKTTVEDYDIYGFPENFSAPSVQNLSFDFNPATGNLDSRTDHLKSRTETFTYDNLNRLKTSQATGYQLYSVNYHTNGNIQNKTDAGTSYNYHPTRIHAVDNIQNIQNTSLYQQDIQFTPYQQPSQITEATTGTSYQLTYTYGHDYQRRKAVQKLGTTTQYTRLYLGAQENNITLGGTDQIHYISGGNGLCAIVVRRNGSDTYYYPYSDHLGSILTVTNSTGAIVAEQNFDAWGRKRNPSTWHYPSVPSVPTWLYRGYTGHEHLDEFKLVNMNGRLYDPVVGRMLSPDNYVSSLGHSQGFNRYSYALNNPLKYNDPDGEWVHVVVGAVVGGIINGVIHADGNGGFWKGFGIGAVAGAVTAATGGAAAAALGLAETGFISGVVTGGVGAIIGSPIQGIGNAVVFGDPYSEKRWLADVVGGAAVGGVTSGVWAAAKGKNFWTGRAKPSTGITTTLDDLPDGPGSSRRPNKSGVLPEGKIEPSPAEFAGVIDDHGNVVSEVLDGVDAVDPNIYRSGSGVLAADVAMRGFDAVGAFKNAISPFKGGNLTNAGRAVTKHPEYFGFESTEALMIVHRSPSALNDLGSSTLKDILRNGAITMGAGGRYPNGWVTYTLPNGKAASWGLDGTFIGFRGIK